MRGHGRQARIEQRVPPHRLRHTFATHLIQAGVRLVTVRDLLGHQPITNPQIYDARGALTALSAQSDFNWPTPTVTGPYANFLWPDAGWTVSVTHPQSASCRYGYDPLGRLAAVNPDTLPSSGADARYTYDVVGNLHSTSYRNAVATTYTFNPRNWLRCLTSVLGAAVVASFDYDGALAAPGQPWLAETCLSPTGQRRAMMETVGTATRTVAYSYDLLSRLTKEDIQSATASPTALVAYDGTGTSQGYDRVGNRRSRQVTGTLPGVSAYTGHTFSERDLLNPNPQTGYTYDLNGNTTQEPGGTLYAYDAENRLVKVTKPDGTTITLAYDADGNRVKKVVDAPGTANDSTTLYLVDDRNPTGYAQVIEERDAAGATTVTYTYGLDLVSQRRGTKVSYYGYDGLGSVRYLTDETGAVTDTYTYDAFGILIGQQVRNGGVLEPVTPLNHQLSTPNSYCYTGEQWDENLDFYYLRARFYQPQLGRFWTMDSYEGNQNDPLSLHKYLYAQANPVNMVDPSGHFGIFKFTRDFGNEAHRVIESQYQAEHPGAIVGPTTGILSTGLKPDIFNGPARKYAEIKPLSLSGVAAGIAQIAMYEAAFTAQGLLTGVRYSRETWPDGVRGAHVFTQPIAYFNVAGVIFYTDMTSNVDDLAKITTYAAAREFIRRGLVQRTLQGALVRIPGLVAARGVADTGRLQMHVGLAVMLRF